MSLRGGWFVYATRRAAPAAEAVWDVIWRQWDNSESATPRSDYCHLMYYSYCSASCRIYSLQFLYLLRIAQLLYAVARAAKVAVAKVMRSVGWEGRTATRKVLLMNKVYGDWMQRRTFLSRQFNAFMKREFGNYGLIRPTQWSLYVGGRYEIRESS